jgi:Domain of unknown function (DUF4149)
MLHAKLAETIIAANIGIITFFTIAVAPTVFKVLPAQWAAKYVRSFFPKYYIWLGVTSIVAALLSTATSTQILLAGTGVMFFFSCWGLTPLINRSNDDGRLRTFKWLHGSSIVLNMFQLGLFIWLLTIGAK